MGKQSNNKAKGIAVKGLAALGVLYASLSFAHTYSHDENDAMVRVIERGTIVQIQQLLDEKIDINQNIGQDGTPLIIAVQNENVELVKYLVERGADVNEASIQDGNPIINAALRNNVELLNYLFDQGAGLDNIVEHDETALISASRAGNYEAVKFLVENGANVNLAVEVEKLRGGTELRSPLNGAKTKEIHDYLVAHGASS